MKKILSVLVLVTVFSIAGYSQLMVAKLLGKNSGNSKLGYGSLHSSDIDNTIGYISIKGGYFHIFKRRES